MEQLQIIEGNKLIAEFMDDIYTLERGNIINFLEKPSKFETSNSFEANELLYHSSFDWLMPVVEKIEGMGIKVEIEGNGCDINRLNPFHPYNNGAACDSKIESVWLALVEFIKWYNQNK